MGFLIFASLTNVIASAEYPPRRLMDLIFFCVSDKAVAAVTVQEE